MASLKNHPGKWLRDDAAAAFNEAEDKHGIFTVNSAGRTVAEQNELIRRWKVGGKYNRPPYLYQPASVEGSNHVRNGGVAVDIQDYNRFKAIAANYGFKWLGSSDPVHFDFVGRPGGGSASTSDLVKAEQNFLNIVQGEKLQVDGIRGPATIAAYKRYQQYLASRGWYAGAVDGIWGQGTQRGHEKRYAEWLASQAPKPAPAGNSSDVVRAVQAKLKANYPLYAGRLVVDGIAGPATRAAVKEFQRRSGITADGIIGPQTRARLGV